MFYIYIYISLWLRYISCITNERQQQYPSIVAVKRHIGTKTFKKKKKTHISMYFSIRGLRYINTY